MVLIGVDPHKGSHTAVVVDGDEHEMARLMVRADRRQLTRLLSFAEPFGERTWAIESAGGLGFLLAQQLVNAGEDVVDVPPTLAACSVAGVGSRVEKRPERCAVHGDRSVARPAPAHCCR
jgi:transposase